MENFIITPLKSEQNKLGEILIKRGMEFLANSKNGNIIVDLAEYTMIHSDILGALINLVNRYNLKDRKVILLNIHVQILELLDNMNLTNFFSFEIEPSDAVKEKRSENKILTVDFEKENNIGIFIFKGSVNSSTDSGMFMNIINKIISEKDKMVIDTTGITYIDSLGIGVLIRLIKLTKEGKTQIRFCGSNKYLSEILDSINLSDLIKIYKTREEALKEWV